MTQADHGVVSAPTRRILVCKGVVVSLACTAHTLTLRELLPNPKIVC